MILRHDNKYITLSDFEQDYIHIKQILSVYGHFTSWSANHVRVDTHGLSGVWNKSLPDLNSIAKIRHRTNKTVDEASMLVFSSELPQISVLCDPASAASHMVGAGTPSSKVTA
jgi:hypothetical protein